MERAKGFEPRHPPWQGGALPTELRPQTHQYVRYCFWFKHIILRYTEQLNPYA